MWHIDKAPGSILGSAPVPGAQLSPFAVVCDPDKPSSHLPSWPVPMAKSVIVLVDSRRPGPPPPLGAPGPLGAPPVAPPAGVAALQVFRHWPGGKGGGDEGGSCGGSGGDAGGSGGGKGGLGTLGDETVTPPPPLGPEGAVPTPLPTWLATGRMRKRTISARAVSIMELALCSSVGREGIGLIPSRHSFRAENILML